MANNGFYSSPVASYPSSKMTTSSSTSDAFSDTWKQFFLSASSSVATTTSDGKAIISSSQRNERYSSITNPLIISTAATATITPSSISKSSQKETKSKLPSSVSWSSRLGFSNAFQSNNDLESQSSSTSFSWWPSTWVSSSSISWSTCGLTRWQRLTCFIFCLLLGFFCLSFSFFNIPISIIRPQRFVLPFTFGCLLLSSCIGFLIGWDTFFNQLTTKERLPISIFNASVIALTMLASLKIKSYPLIIICSIMEICGLITLLFSLIPGGVTALGTSTRLIGGYFYRSLST